jgi:hypothetical protein
MVKAQNNLEKNRKQRLKDFEDRIDYEIKNHYKTTNFNSEFITVHPMSDEIWWFQEYGGNLELIKSVDLYWKFDGDVAFVQIHSGKVLESEFFGLWKNRLYLRAKVEDNLISYESIQKTLELLWKKHLENNLFQRFLLKENYCQIN